MSFNEVKQIINSVEGWLLDGEAEELFNVAKNCKGKGEIVEIGSWKGKSTICLAKGSKLGANIIVTAIDPHIGSTEHKKTFGKVETFLDFKKNIRLAGIEDLVHPIVASSETVAKDFIQPVEFIFIDGAHEYSEVKKDFFLWFPKVLNGGIMAFHDTTCFPGPKKLVEERVYKSRKFRNIRLVDSTTFAEKVFNNSFKDRVKNRYVLLIKKIYELSSKLHPPQFIKMFGKKILNQIH